MQDYLFAASMLGDGTVMLAGDTEGSWGAVNAGHKDFVAVILDSNGNETRRWQVSGLVTAAVTTPLPFCASRCVAFENPHTVAAARCTFNLPTRTTT